MKKYAEIPKNDVDTKVEKSWFKTCRANNTPFITVKARTKFADVHWNYITYPTEIDKVFDELGTKLRDEAIAIFMKYADKQSEYSVSGRLVWFKNLEISKAKLAAAELHDLIAQHVESGRA